MILNEVIKDLRNKDETILLHYAIEWRDRTKNALKFTTITSYFSGRTFKEIIDKFSLKNVIRCNYRFNNSYS